MSDTARSTNGRNPTALDARVRQLELDGQQRASDHSNHEKICAVRYAGIQSDLGEVKADVKEIRTILDEIKKAQVKSAGISEGFARARKPNPWLVSASSGIAALLLGMILSWLARDHVQGGLGAGISTTTTSTVSQPKTIPPPLDQTATP